MGLILQDDWNIYIHIAYIFRNVTSIILSLAVKKNDNLFSVKKSTPRLAVKKKNGHLFFRSLIYLDQVDAA